ncbi:alpha/beta fold hydrolase [Arenimonas sp.]|jgi:predicted alpha/beta-hydrolase family hydrolase|uniref:alpha/beta fold hydrolase n=1 Tax=Arenimonas sp. TaxID=1872635 RepID=UPI0037BE4597
MSGHVIISHGLNSGPDATKATALAQACDLLGWSCERPDYREFDAIMPPLGDVQARIERLHSLAAGVTGPVVLAGSSMGAFISAQVSLRLPVRGLFLMAPPISLEGYEMGLQTSAVPLSIVHGWHDELIAADDVAQWAKHHQARICLVNDDHRLGAHIDFCAQQFALFLGSLS